MQLPTIQERYEYLRLDGDVGDITFGGRRLINQEFYRHDDEWKRVRRSVIIRDKACDLGMPGYEIVGRVIVHHMNPIDEFDIVHRTKWLLDPEYLICVSELTDRAIHFGDNSLMPKEFVERKPFDTAPWRK